MKSRRQTITVAFAVAFVATACGMLASMPTAAGASSRASTSDQVTSSLSPGLESNPTCSATRLGSAQTVVGQYLSDRATQLQILSSRISNTKSIPAADASTLQGIVSNEETGVTDGGITGLETMVKNTTTCLQVVSDATTMVVDFRVFTVVSPQVDLTAVASVEQAIIAKATALEPKIEAAITAAQNRGVNVTAAQAAYNSLVSEVSETQGEVSHVSISNLIAQLPSSYPGDAAVLVGYHEDVVAAATDLRSAYENAMTIVHSLTP